MTKDEAIQKYGNEFSKTTGYFEVMNFQKQRGTF